MPIQEDIRLAAEVELEYASKTEREEVGCSCSIDYVFDRRGNMTGYVVSVETDGGFAKKFPRVAATEPPDTEFVVRKYMFGSVEEIRKRRQARRKRVRERRQKEGRR